MTDAALLDCKLPPRMKAFNRTCKLSFPGNVVPEFSFTNTLSEYGPELKTSIRFHLEAHGHASSAARFA